MPAHHDHGRREVLLSQFIEHCQPVNPRELHIEQDRVEGLLVELVECDLGAAGDLDVVAF
jgi:hypothetical protein